MFTIKIMFGCLAWIYLFLLQHWACDVAWSVCLCSRLLLALIFVVAFIRGWKLLSLLEIKYTNEKKKKQKERRKNKREKRKSHKQNTVEQEIIGRRTTCISSSTLCALTQPPHGHTPACWLNSNSHASCSSILHIYVNLVFERINARTHYSSIRNSP